VDTARFVSEFHAVPQIFNIDDYAEARRPVMPVLSVAERFRSVDEVELGLDEEAARAECRRCLRCDLEWLGASQAQSTHDDALRAAVLMD
jgi:hypothetical protein